VIASDSRWSMAGARRAETGSNCCRAMRASAAGREVLHETFRGPEAGRYGDETRPRLFNGLWGECQRKPWRAVVGMVWSGPAVEANRLAPLQADASRLWIICRLRHTHAGNSPVARRLMIAVDYIDGWIMPPSAARHLDYLTICLQTSGRHGDCWA
jgi:hypothetical protein